MTKFATDDTDSPATGGQTSWLAARDGIWDNPASWSAGVPDDSETASFATGSGSAYVVAGDGAAADLLVADQVELDGTVSVADRMSVGGSLTIGGEMDGDGTITGTVSITAPSGTGVAHWDAPDAVDVTRGTLSVNHGALNVGGDGLVLTAAGKLVMTAFGAIEGRITIDGGQIQGAASLAEAPVNAPVVLSNAVTLGTDGPNLLSGGRNTGLVITGPISGDGALTIGGGVVTLSGANTYRGGTVVQDGELILGREDAAGSGPIRFGDSGVLGGNLDTLDDLNLSGSGFAQGDGIDLLDLDPVKLAVTANYDTDNGKLSISANGVRVDTVQLPTGLSGTFSVASDASRLGTTISLAPGLGNDAAVATGAATASDLYGVDGADVTVGVISDSLNFNDGLAQDVANGLLPASLLSTYQRADDGTGTADEGRAMSQLVHEVAPGANILFQPGFPPGASSFEDGMVATIKTLIGEGARIIVDDVANLQEPFFNYASPLGEEIEAATAEGVTFFTSAGNRGTGYYEQSLSFGSATLPGTTSPQTVIEFSGTGTPTEMEPIDLSANTAGGTLGLQWVATDPDLKLQLHLYQIVDGVETDISGERQDVTGCDIISVAAPIDGASYALAITANEDTGDGTFKFQFGGSPSLSVPGGGIGGGSEFGHALDPNEITVGAVPYDKTPAYGTTAPVNESFSSPGPGEVITASNGIVSTTTLSKPDLSAPDALPTTVSLTNASDPAGLDHWAAFSGTSASAPVAAAVAALMLQADPHLNASDIDGLLKDSAYAMADPVTAGAGLVQAVPAVRFAATHVITTIPNGNATLYGTHESDEIIAGAAPATVVGGGGDDTVFAGSGGTSVSGAASGTILFVGGPTGSATLGAGAATVTVWGAGGGGVYHGGTNGNNMLRAGGGNTTLVGGGAGDLLMGASSASANEVLFAATGQGSQGAPETLVGGAGHDALWAANGPATLFAGSGSDTLGGGGGAATLVGGSGTSVMVGGSGSDTMFGGAGGTTVFTGSGNQVIVGGSGNLTATLGSGTASVWCGSGETSVVCGSGTAAVTCGSGPDLISAVNGQSAGSASVYGFVAGRDHLAGLNYSAGPRVTQSGGNTVVTFSDKTTITLIGVSGDSGLFG